MKAIRYLTFFLLFPLASHSQFYDWSKQIAGNHEAIPHSIVTDLSGNIYIAGYFQGTLDFDPGPNVFNMTPIMFGNDIFVAKWDSSGNFLWAIQKGSSSNDYCISMTVDPLGNIYITGQYGISIYIAKIDPSGSFLWERYLNSTINGSKGEEVVLDLLGNVYITGSFFNGTVDFDPGPATYNLTTIGSSMDAFLLKLSNAGNFIWAKSFGGVSVDKTLSVALDSSGNIALMGVFSDSVDFDPDTSTAYYLYSDTLSSTFISKLDSSGSFIWAKQFDVNITGWYFTSALVLNKGGEIYACGSFIDTTDFDPGPGLNNLVSAAYADGYILKLNSFGDFIWVKQFSGPGEMRFHDIILDTNENLYSIGLFTGYGDFNPGLPNYILISEANSEDSFISRIDSSGEFVWVKKQGGVGWDRGYSLSLYNDNQFYTLGFFSDTAYFDNSPSAFLVSGTYFNIFVAKYHTCNNYSFSTIIDTICGEYISPSGNFTWTNSGIYTDIISNSAGCDSIITIYLTIFPFELPVIIGDSLICQGDSTSFSTSISYNSYFWNTGETAPAISVDSTGIYSVVVTEMNGCSAMTSIFLNVLGYPIVSIISQGPTTFCRGDSVILTAPPALSSYQWYRFNTIIPGATSMDYVAKSRGKYKCIAQNAALCSDTSNIITVNVPCIPIGPNHQRLEYIDESEILNILIYPNPGTGIFTIQSPPGQLQIYNSMGQLIYLRELFTEENLFDISAFSDGIYFMTLKVENALYSHKLLLAR